MAAALKPTAPPSLRLRFRTKASPCTMAGSTRQYHRMADSALITINSGRSEKARLTMLAGWVTVKGAGPPPI